MRNWQPTPEEIKKMEMEQEAYLKEQAKNAPKFDIKKLWTPIRIIRKDGTEGTTADE